MPFKTHELLVRKRDQIIAEWEQAVRGGPQQISLGDSALRNELPEFLDELAVWMEGKLEPAEGMLRGTPSAHAAQRLKHAYELRQLLDEYRILRETLLRLVLREEASAQEAGPEETVDRVKELARLNAAFDRAISDSVEHFVAERERIRERFIGILSHDLRTPIGNILTSADFMLRSGKLQDGLDQPAARIARNAERMTRMVRDLLDLARGRLGGGVPISVGHADMGEVCRTVVEEMTATNPGRQIAFDMKGNLWGEWDRDRALQAIGNLLSNALRHGRDPVTLTVRDAGTHVAVGVGNRGAAIPPPPHPDALRSVPPRR